MSTMRTAGVLRVAFVFAILTGGIVYIAVWAAIWFVHGDYMTTALCLGGVALLTGLILHTAFGVSGRARPRTEFSRDGTLVRPQKLPDVAFGTGLAIGVLSAAIYLAFSQLGTVAYTPSGILRVAFPAACAFYVIFGIPVLYRMLKFRDGSHLRIDPSGFEVWDGQWNTFVRGGWDDVQQILDHPVRGKTSVTDVIVFVLGKRKSAKLVTNSITADSHALREWVRFYWQHPEYREELVDSRGVHRLEDQRFSPSDAA